MLITVVTFSARLSDRLLTVVREDPISDID